MHDTFSVVCNGAGRVFAGEPDGPPDGMALGGPKRRALFLLSGTGAYPELLRDTRLSRLDAVTVDTPGAGLP